ncbi:transposase family protein, partial [Streptomyces sp. NPDC002159]
PMITKPVPALLCTPTGHGPTNRPTPELAQALPRHSGRRFDFLHHRTCIQALPALSKAAAGLPTLADKGYIGAGIGIHVPLRRPKGRTEQALHADTCTTHNLIRSIRVLGERAAAELKQRWRTLQHVTISPRRIGDIARAALVLNRIQQ